MLLSSLFKQPNEGRFTIATSERNHRRYKRIAHSISWVILHTAVISCTFKMNFSEGYPQSELTLNSKNQVITSFQQKFIHMTFVPATSFFPSHSALVFNTSLKNSEFPANLTGWAQSDWHWVVLCHIHIHYQRKCRPAVQHKTQSAKLLCSLGRQIYLLKEINKERKSNIFTECIKTWKHNVRLNADRVSHIKIIYTFVPSIIQVVLLFII